MDRGDFCCARDFVGRPRDFRCAREIFDNEGARANPIEAKRSPLERRPRLMCGAVVPRGQRLEPYVFGHRRRYVVDCGEANRARVLWSSPWSELWVLRHMGSTRNTTRKRTRGGATRRKGGGGARKRRRRGRGQGLGGDCRDMEGGDGAPQKTL